MHESKRHKKHEKRKKRREKYRHRLLVELTIAYVIVLALWTLPIPNPVKLLTVTFHELSHGVAALATGGRVFGIAIDPGGGGVTIGIGGYYPLILVAGYLGSSLIGGGLFWMSVRWKPNLALLALLVFVLGSMLFGWLSTYTAIFGFGSVVMMLVLFPLQDDYKLFFIRLVGCACCLYAPMEIATELFGIGAAPAVTGVQTPSDVSELSRLSQIPEGFVALALLLLQGVWLVWLIRWTSEQGARRGIRVESAERKEIRQRQRDLAELDKVMQR